MDSDPRDLPGRLRDKIAAARPRAEIERRLPSEPLDDLRDGGAFRLSSPQASTLSLRATAIDGRSSPWLNTLASS